MRSRFTSDLLEALLVSGQYGGGGMTTVCQICHQYLCIKNLYTEEIFLLIAAFIILSQKQIPLPDRHLIYCNAKDVK